MTGNEPDRHGLDDEQILENLVALNAERAAEERAGQIRWLRPDYQNDYKDSGGAGQNTQAEIAATVQQQAKKVGKQTLPADLPGRFAAVRSALAQLPEGGNAETIATQFKSANRKTVTDILETLTALGQTRQDEAGRYQI